METLLVIAGLTLGLFAAARGVFHASTTRTLVAVVLLSTASALAIAALRRPVLTEPHVDNRPIEVPGDEYVTSDTCRSCHPDAYATWHASFHRTMTQPASPTSIEAPFDGVELETHGRTYRLSRRGDEFWVDMDDPDAPVEEPKPGRVQRRIVMVTGSHTLQIYWIETGRGRALLQFPFDYRIDVQRWIPDFASFLQPPIPKGARLPATGPGRWDVGCIRCHATHGQPRLDLPGAMRGDTRVAEFGIACEACHGPGEAHVAANRDPRRRYRLHRTKERDPTIVDPANLSHRLSAQTCGQCHSINTHPTDEDRQTWRNGGYTYRPGQDLTDTRRIIRRTNDLTLNAEEKTPDYLPDDFWPDGMVRLAGREHNGLIESPCYQRGEMSCLSCHVMHKTPDDPRPMAAWTNDLLGPGMRGNQACLQCHHSYTEQAELARHTHHEPGSTGSLCYNCHMPHTSYGLFKAIRSHQIDSPTAAVTIQTGRPNACNLCHLDKTLGWTAAYLERWYDTPQPEMTADERAIAMSLLMSLRGDAAQRALAAWAMGWDPAREASGSDWIPPFLGQLLLDPYDAVRFIAFRSLRGIAGYEALTYDFMAPPELRMETARRVREIWQLTGPDHARDAESLDGLLIDEQGNLRIDVIRRLLQQVNRRPVDLRE